MKKKLLCIAMAVVMAAAMCSCTDLRSAKTGTDTTDKSVVTEDSAKENADTKADEAEKAAENAEEKAEAARAAENGIVTDEDGIIGNTVTKDDGIAANSDVVAPEKKAENDLDVNTNSGGSGAPING